ncbi:hypothetical protein [Oceanibaculum pacificum]|nr:hypothetical protein [Oceanibaculum pacificum]
MQGVDIGPSVQRRRQSGEAVGVGGDEQGLGPLGHAVAQRLPAIDPHIDYEDFRPRHRLQLPKAQQLVMTGTFMTNAMLAAIYK